MRLLVTGATGFLGGHLVRALLAGGYDVRLSGRNVAAAQRVALSAEFFPADLRDVEAVAAACKGIDAVFHVGALAAAWGRRADFYAVNVGGTENVIAGCLKHGIARLIYVSSPSVVFNGRDQYALNEEAPFPRRFSSLYAATKKLGEDRVRSASLHLATIIVRPKAIFGPGDGSLLPRLVDAARRKRLIQIGAGCNCVDLTYVDNAVDALLLALRSDRAVGHLYTITNGEPRRLWEVIRYVLHRLGVGTEWRRLPYSAAYALAFLMEAASGFSSKEPILTRYTVGLLGRTQTFDIGAAQRDLGYVPAVSLADGLERTIESWKLSEESDPTREQILC